MLGALVWLATIVMVRRDRAASEYGRPILPTWLGLVGMLPCVPALIAVVAMWRR